MGVGGCLIWSRGGVGQVGKLHRQFSYTCTNVMHFFFVYYLFVCFWGFLIVLWWAVLECQFFFHSTHRFEGKKLLVCTWLKCDYGYIDFIFHLHKKDEKHLTALQVQLHFVQWFWITLKTTSHFATGLPMVIIILAMGT